MRNKNNIKIHWWNLAYFFKIINNNKENKKHI